MRPINVCFMIDRLRRAGTEGQLVALIKQVNRSQVRPSLCLLDGEDEQSRSLEPDDCPVIRLGIRSLARRRTLRRCRQLAAALRNQRTDVLQLFFRDSTYLGALAGYWAGVPHVVRTRNNIGHWITPVDRVLNRVCRRFITHTLVNSEAGREAIVSTEGVSGEMVTVLENGVDIDRFAWIGPLSPVAPVRPRIGTVANLRAVKGIDLLIKAALRIARTLPGVEFLVAGEGEDRPALEQLLSTTGLAGQFRLLGQIEDIPSFLASLDIAVLCSRAEGSPNAVLEYMAAGRPIVAARVGGVGRLLDHEVHGLLVEPENPAALADSILALLQDRQAALRMSQAARMRAMTEFTRAAMIDRYERFLFRLMSKGGRREERA